MIVVGSDLFSKQLADFLEVGHVLVEKRIFPDKEVCPRVYFDVPDPHVVLVNRLDALGIDPNKYFMETLLLAKTLKAQGAERLDLVMPYLMYARQDKVFRPGEPLSVKFVLEALRDAGVDRIFTVTSHCQRDRPRLDAPLPVYNADGFHAIGEYLRRRQFEKPFIIGADRSMSSTVAKLAASLGTDGMSMEKHRDLDTGYLTMKGVAEAEGRHVVIVDDMISSGGTMLKAIERARESGARQVSVACVHLLASPEITQKIASLCDQFIVTDTIENPAITVSVVPLVGREIQQRKQVYKPYFRN